MVQRHNHYLFSGTYERPVELALQAADSASGLVIACALVKGGRLSDVTVKTITKKAKEKSFAAGCERDRIALIAPILALPEFYAVAIAGLMGIREELGLTWPPRGRRKGIRTPRINRGASVMISPEQQRNDVLTQLSRAVVLVEESMDPRLISGAGTNIGFAVRGARDSSGVAAVMGGLVLQDNSVKAAGACGFGTDIRIAQILLTALKFDPEIRCAATIRHTDSVRRTLEDMFLECCTVDSRRQPPSASTMDWGVASCCREGVPEAIIDPGTSKMNSVIHLFGEKPADVAGNIIMLSNRIIRIEL